MSQHNQPHDLVKTLDALSHGTGLSTQRNAVLPAPPLTPAIPSREGIGKPAPI